MNVDDIRSLPALLEYVRQGGKTDYLFFWGPEKSAGEIGRGCLCQWYEASFEIDGTVYATAEHFMMAEKARVFGDEAMRARLLATPNPALAKLLGRKVRNFDEATWLHHRYAVVVKGSMEKFAQNDELRRYLLATRGRILAEASPVDRIWGVGLAQSDQAIQGASHWTGLNLLGFALMEARARLANCRTY